MVMAEHRGVLMGAEGMLIAKRHRHCVVISLTLIRQAGTVDIDGVDVEPLTLWPQEISTPPFGS
jgi:hypothetical protein